MFKGEASGDGCKCSIHNSSKGCALCNTDEMQTQRTGSVTDFHVHQATELRGALVTAAAITG